MRRDIKKCYTQCMATSLHRAQKIQPCLWFDTNAAEAVEFYTSVFPDSKVKQTTYYGDNMHKPKGTVLCIQFEIFGQAFLALNAGPEVTFNDAISLIINCDTQAEIDTYWEKLTSGGGNPVQCGWLKDRFGVSWQVAPSFLPELMSDQARCDRVMQAVMQMVKLDIATMKAAAEGR